MFIHIHTQRHRQKTFMHKRIIKAMFYTPPLQSFLSSSPWGFHNRQKLLARKGLPFLGPPFLANKFFGIVPKRLIDSQRVDIGVQESYRERKFTTPFYSVYFHYYYLPCQNLPSFSLLFCKKL